MLQKNIVVKPNIRPDFRYPALPDIRQKQCLVHNGKYLKEKNVIILTQSAMILR
jgi:hypothetical protein